MARTLWEDRKGAGYVLQRLQDRLRQQVAVLARVRGPAKEPEPI